MFLASLQEKEKAPAFKLPIYVKNIQKGKHGSDSGVYDANGRYLIRTSIYHHLHVKIQGSDNRLHVSNTLQYPSF